MNYQVNVEWAPAYELVLSLEAYLFNSVKNLDLGAEWVEGVRARLHGPLATLTKWRHCDDPFILAILIRQSPAPRTAESFLPWLGALTAGEAYELLLPYLPACGADLLRRLPETLSEYTRVLTAWHEQYFRTVDGALLARLATEATERAERILNQPPVPAVDEATTGIVVESVQIDEVLLIPQYHLAPLNQYLKCNRTLVIWYAPELRADQPGLPPTRLLRTAKALGDENRLRILHFLADGEPHSFTDVQRFTGLAKNSVSYHLMSMRAAGLIRVHLAGECCNDRYTARRATIDQLSPGLQQFLDAR